MKAEYDFSKGERSKFHNPKAVFNLPIYLEKDVDHCIHKLGRVDICVIMVICQPSPYPIVNGQK